MYTLIHFQRTQVKGKYKETCRITFMDKWRAYSEAREFFDNATAPEYAGFMLKDKDGKTLCRQVKPQVL